MAVISTSRISLMQHIGAQLQTNAFLPKQSQFVGKTPFVDTR